MYLQSIRNIGLWSQVLIAMTNQSSSSKTLGANSMYSRCIKRRHTMQVMICSNIRQGHFEDHRRNLDNASQPCARSISLQYNPASRICCATLSCRFKTLGTQVVCFSFGRLTILFLLCIIKICSGPTKPSESHVATQPMELSGVALELDSGWLDPRVRTSMHILDPRLQ